MNNDKVIVTNYRALRDKYGADGLSRIQEEIKKLIAKDKEEGLKSQVIDLSSSSHMDKVKGKAVTDSQNRRAVKAAIDAIYKSIVPDYLMILGAQDIVPFQQLENPVFDPAEGDPDQFVPSDLPYACDAAYSQDPTRFIGPTRVIGRLPDMLAAKRPDYILKLLKIAAGRVSRPASEYATHFGVTAWEWKESTRKSLEKLFGVGKDAHTSPDKGPDWEDGHLSARAHFINCHGSIARPVFHGQRGNRYPVAHESRLLTGRVTEGTVVAVECCYGAELYDPALSGNLMGICYSYLVNGAYGYCGSTTIAYGPPDDNGQADLICQYFLKKVLGGASLGRAMLEARQQFAQGAAQLDPYDLKTLIQFNLMGDPSIHPVAKKTGSVAASKRSGAAALASERSVNRSDRRRLLVRTGAVIQETQLVAKRIGEKAKPEAVQRKLNAILTKEGLRGAGIKSFEVASADGAGATRSLAKTPLAKMPKPEAFYVISKRQPGVGDGDVAITGIVAREVDGEIVSYKKVVSR